MNRISLDPKQAARLIGCGVRFFLSAALSGCLLLGDAPFALGLLAAAGAGAEGLAALAGAGVGALLFMDFAGGLRFFATAILIFSTVTAFAGTRLSHQKWFFPAAAAGLFFAIRLIYLLQSPRLWDQLFPAIAATLVVGVSAWIYGLLLWPQASMGRQAAVLYLAVSLLVGLTGLLLPGGVSCGRILACALVLFAAYTQGMGLGAAAGVCIGLFMDLAAGSGGLFFAAAYGFLGLSAGLRSQLGRGSAAACGLGALLLLLLPVTAEEGVALLWEMLGGTAIFLALPARLFGGKRIRPAKSREDGEQLPLLDRLRDQLNQSAAAFRDLYDSFSRAPSTEENPAVVFDRAAERVCRGCALCDICWQREYTDTFNAMNDATPLLLERGRALAKDFPVHFASRCIHLPDLLTAVNTELSAFLLRRQYRRQVEAARREAKGQYAQMSELLSSTAAHLEAGAKPVSVELGVQYAVGAALRPKEGETVSGDSLTAFETDDGYLYLVLSDGMGTGDAARRESAMTLRLLERFLQAGVEAEAALKTLNNALSLRSADTGSFTTIDLLRLKLSTGEAVIYKYGAAPSYIKRGGRVRRITGSALPAGLHTEPTPPDATAFRLEDDSFVVLISDGVTDADHDEWLQNLLAGWQGEDPQALVGLILAEARRQGCVSDDCGVQILYLPETGVREI